MTSLLSLPTELLQTIGDDLGPAKKQLRLVCAHLGLAMEPLILSHVVIDITRSRIPTVTSQLSLLASKDRRSAYFVRELSIRSLSPTRGSQSSGARMAFVGGRWDVARDPDTTKSDEYGQSVMKKSLEDAISNMVNVQVVRWCTTFDDPTWATLAVISGLSRSKSLFYLNLHLAFGFDTSNLRLDLLNGLKRIVISGSCKYFHQHIVKRLGDCVARSPEMSSIDIDRHLWHADSDIPTLHSLLGSAKPLQLKHLGLQNWYTRFDDVTLPHLRSLTSLTLISNNDPPYSGHPFSSTSTEIWSGLQASKIRLERISTDTMDAALLEYLASYSGLTRLYLKDIAAPDHQSSDQLAELFFDSVLTQHSSMLEDLYIIPRYEGKWCFGERIVPSIIRCSSLQYLKLAVSSSAVNPLSQGNIVNILINMVSRHLHALKSLSVTAAQPESLRGSGHAAASKKHFSFVTNHIANAITAYESEHAYEAFLPTITANSIKYIPRIINEPDLNDTQSQIRYRRIQ